MTDSELANWLKLLAAIAVFITATGLPAVLAIINAIKNGQADRAGQAAIATEQKNRELATLGAEPVTMQSPPMGTGDGRIDAAVTKQLASAPTSPSTVPASAIPPTTGTGTVAPAP